MNTIFKNSNITIPGILLLLILQVSFLQLIIDANTSAYKKIIILGVTFIMLILSYLDKIDNKIYLLTLISYLLFLIQRSPEIFAEGRFFAEEGAIYWSYSLVNSKIDTLLYTPVIAGYYLFVSNFQILITTFFPINFSPLITVWLSLIISLLPSILFFVLTNNKLDNKKRIIISQILLFLPSLNFLEIFVNSINSQTYLGVSVFIIYIYGLEGKNKNITVFENIILIFGSLSSYYSLILFPVFLFRYMENRNLRTKFPLIIWIFSVFIQINVLYFSYFNNALYGGKFTNKIDFQYLLLIIKNSFLVNLFTEYFLRDSFIQNISLIILLLVLFLIIKNKTTDKYVYFLILLSFALEVVLIIIGQAGQDFIGRYAAVPSTILFFLLLHYLSQINYGHLFLIFIFSITLINTSYQNSSYFINCEDYCSSWENQLEEYNNGNSKIIIHWPIGEGDPYWYTDLETPLPNPAPFQKEAIGANIDLVYDLTLLDIVKSNFQLRANP